jgi:hypothetical protein
LFADDVCQSKKSSDRLPAANAPYNEKLQEGFEPLMASNSQAFDPTGGLTLAIIPEIYYDHSFAVSQFCKQPAENPD